MIAPRVLSGYLLEEVLVHLLRGNGYTLLKQVADDPDALVMKSNGLRVRGRGAEHQADALGELRVPVPFSLPIRLFVEAKNRGKESGLGDARNAHGVIHDVNERFSTEAMWGYTHPLRRHRYCYALFSTGGFSSDAQFFALAHQLSLIDLSGPDFKHLRDLVDEATKELHGAAEDTFRLKRFPVGRMRALLREALDRLDDVIEDVIEDAVELAAPRPTQKRSVGREFDTYLSEWARRFTLRLNQAAGVESLLLGFPPAPFILVLNPTDLGAFEEYVGRHGPNIDVDIHFQTETGLGGDWTVTPSADPGAFYLSFGLPGALEKWLLSVPANSRATKIAQAKETLFAHIDLFLENRLVRLTYTPTPLRPLIRREATNARSPSTLRTKLKTPPDAPRRPPKEERPLPSETQHHPVVDDSHSGWNEVAAESLMRQLRGRVDRQAELLRAAAEHGGTLSRSQVYEIAEFPEARTLRGLTRPSRRITAELIAGGHLSSDAGPPFVAHLEKGFATHFTMPQDLVDILARNPKRRK